MRLKQRVFNLMLWGLAILVTIVVIVGFLCWMGVIPASILTQPIRRMSNLLVAFVLFVPKTFPKIKTILNDLLIKTARALRYSGSRRIASFNRYGVPDLL